jgi:kynurenine formamidase/beta-lactamase class A
MRRHVLGLALISFAFAPAWALQQPPPSSPTSERVVDLGHPLSEADPTWTGEKVFTHEATQSEGILMGKFSSDEHFGTHLDAPKHFFPGGWSVDRIPPDRLVRPAVCMDVRQAVSANEDYRVTPNDILAFERQHGAIAEGTVVFVRTGWDARWSDPARYRNERGGVKHFPGVSVEAASLLAKDRRVAGIGIDTPSIDYGPSVQFEAHRTTMPQNVYHIENAANLGAVPATGFRVVVAPIAIKDGSGGPTRVLALVPEGRQVAAESASAASAVSRTTWHPKPSGRLDGVLGGAMRAALDAFRSRRLTPEQLAATLIDLRDPDAPEIASVGGDRRIYPASVVKLFYLAAAEQWMEDGRIVPDAEFTRAVHDMIVDSSNDATAFVLDTLTSTSSGPTLPPAEMSAWSEKRNAVNRHFASLGFANVNANQKTWCEGPYGRDREFLGANRENRNALTTDATARLLAEIVTRRAVTPARSDEMRGLLERDWTARSEDPDNQATGFSGSALPAGAKLWSKAGWTSTVRHDAAYIELPTGARFVLVTFTIDHSEDHEIIPTFARSVVGALR